MSLSKIDCNKMGEAAAAVGKWVYSHPNMASFAVMAVVKVLKKLTARLPHGVVLEVSLDRMEFGEVTQDPMLKSLYGKKICFTKLLRLIEAAEGEGKIKAILVHIGSGGGFTGLAQVEELRNALQKYHTTTGNPVVCYANTFGEGGPGLLDYWLATACTEIVMPNCGGVNITAPSAGPIFLKKMLGKLGLKADITQRSEYKNAANMFREEKMTDAHREQTLRLLTQCYDILLEDLATSSVTRDVVDHGPYTSRQAVDLKLVSRVMYYDELVEDHLPMLTGLKNVKMYSMSSFSPFAKDLYGAGFWKSQVAFITLEGGITQGKSQGVYGGSPSIGSDTVCAQLRQVRENSKNIKALLLRVDSRGGSYIASDVIHRELLRVKSSGIPIVVSMGNCAASGGYYLGMVGDAVFANKLTMTGSIGIVNGKVVCGEMMEKIGVGVDPVKGGENAFYWSSVHGFEGADKEVFEAQTDHIYEDFKNNVSAARGLSPTTVETLAKGQVYFGADALSHSLTTHLGGFHAAVAHICEITSIHPSKLHLTPYPRPLSVATLFETSTSREGDDRSPLSNLAITSLLSAWAPGTLASIVSSIRSTIQSELVAWDAPMIV